MRTLETNAVVNESADPALLLKRYERQVRELKQELAMRDMLRRASPRGVFLLGWRPADGG